LARGALLLIDDAYVKRVRCSPCRIARGSGLSRHRWCRGRTRRPRRRPRATPGATSSPRTPRAGAIGAFEKTASSARAVLALGVQGLRPWV